MTTRRRFNLDTTSGKLNHWALNVLKRHAGRGFNMGSWGLKSDACGTACCAAGEAGLSRAFRARGLRTIFSEDGGGISFGEFSDVSAVEKFFGITYMEAYNIVVPSWAVYEQKDRGLRGRIRIGAVRKRILALAKQYEARGL